MACIDRWWRSSVPSSCLSVKNLSRYLFSILRSQVLYFNNPKRKKRSPISETELCSLLRKVTWLDSAVSYVLFCNIMTDYAVHYLPSPLYIGSGCVFCFPHSTRELSKRPCEGLLNAACFCTTLNSRQRDVTSCLLRNDRIAVKRITRF